MNRRRPPWLLTVSMAVLLLLASGSAPFSSALWSSAGTAFRWLQELCFEALRMASPHIPLHLTLSLVPLMLAALALSSAFRQVFATHSLTRRLLEQAVVPTPEPLVRLAIDCGLEDRIRLIDSPEFYAFCFGWLRPQICVSTAVVNELPSTELEAVLRHESWHVQRRDPLRLLVADALGSALFFLPVARELARHYALERELGADGATVRAMNDRRPLAGALYRAATGDSAGPSLQTTVGAFNAVDARIDQLLGGGVPAFRLRRLRAFVSVLMLIGLSLILCVSVMAMNFGSVATCVRC